MGANNCSAAYIERRTNPFIHAQFFRSNRGANNVYNRVDGAHLMKMDLFDITVVNLGFRCAQRLKNPDGPLFRALADSCFVDDLANFPQPAMMMRMAMAVAVSRLMVMIMGMRMSMFRLVPMAVCLRMRVTVFSFVRMRMSMGVPVMFILFFAPEFLSWQLFLSRRNHIYFGSADPAPVHPAYLQTSIHTQGLYRPNEKLGRNSGINQRAHKHVAADPGEAFQVGYTHQRPQSFIIGLALRPVKPRRRQSLCYNRLFRQRLTRVGQPATKFSVKAEHLVSGT